MYNVYFSCTGCFLKKVNHEINILLHIGSISLNMNFFPMFLTLNLFVFLYFLGKVFDHVDDSGDAVFSGLGNLSSNMTDDADESG
jgi:hypothetical protein